jgi:hypothetical protein
VQLPGELNHLRFVSIGKGRFHQREVETGGTLLELMHETTLQSENCVTDLNITVLAQHFRDHFAEQSVELRLELRNGLDPAEPLDEVAGRFATVGESDWFLRVKLVYSNRVLETAEERCNNARIELAATGAVDQIAVNTLDLKRVAVEVLIELFHVACTNSTVRNQNEIAAKTLAKAVLGNENWFGTTGSNSLTINSSEQLSIDNSQLVTPH